jgi:hypothetical protein
VVALGHAQLNVGLVLKVLGEKKEERGADAVSKSRPTQIYTLQAFAPSAISTTGPPGTRKMSSPFCYFADKLPAEIRVLVYGCIFGLATHMKRTPDTKDPADATFKDTRVVLLEQTGSAPLVPMATAILRTDRLISEEAVEVLYKSKTVQLTFTQLHNDVKQQWGYSNSVRQVEFRECTHL